MENHRRVHSFTYAMPWMHIKDKRGGKKKIVKTVKKTSGKSTSPGRKNSRGRKGRTSWGIFKTFLEWLHARQEEKLTIWRDDAGIQKCGR